MTSDKSESMSNYPPKFLAAVESGAINGTEAELGAYTVGFQAGLDAALAVVRRAREEGETDMRQVRAWIEAKAIG